MGRFWIAKPLLSHSDPVPLPPVSARNQARRQWPPNECVQLKEKTAILITPLVGDDRRAARRDAGQHRVYAEIRIANA